MLTIQEYDFNNNYRELQNDPRLFHEALKYVLKGETRFHVPNDGTAGFDLLYINNDRKAKADPTFPDSDFFRSELLFPPYYDYDETDTDKIVLDLLDGFEEIFFEEANEYTIAVAGIALAETSLRVNFRDDRVRFFPWLRDRVGVRPDPETGRPLYVQKNYYPIYITEEHFCSLGLFHCMFMLQWLTDLPRDQIRYLELTIRRTEGIGSILSTFIRVKKAFEKLGIRAYIASGCTRYSDQMLERLFAIGGTPEDADGTNTAYVKCFNSFVLTNLIQRNEAVIDLSILKPEFLAQMKEYADAIIGDKKVLGVLLRGTDYVIANFEDSYRPVSIDTCIRAISERMEQYHYDRIVVATEDSYFLEKILAAFPHRVIAISQERHSVSDFRNIHYLSELEKQNRTADEYAASVEDTTVNYLYAMYMLSRCESLLANCMCSGVNMAESFSQGKYVRVEILSMMKKPD